MVWLVQNCRSNKVCNSSNPRASGGLSPPGPLPELCLGPAGDLKRSPTPRLLTPPLTTNPGSAPGNYREIPSWEILKILAQAGNTGKYDF